MMLELEADIGESVTLAYGMPMEDDDTEEWVMSVAFESIGKVEDASVVVEVEDDVEGEDSIIMEDEVSMFLQVKGSALSLKLKDGVAELTCYPYQGAVQRTPQ
jgi:hypothetical protein